LEGEKDVARVPRKFKRKGEVILREKKNVPSSFSQRTEGISTRKKELTFQNQKRRKEIGGKGEIKRLFSRGIDHVLTAEEGGGRGDLLTWGGGGGGVCGGAYSNETGAP